MIAAVRLFPKLMPPPAVSNFLTGYPAQGGAVYWLMGPKATYAHKSAQTMSDIQKEPFIELAGGRIRCRRCQAESKRSGLQCKRPALAGKNFCDFHGGRSTGPKAPEGRQRIADAQTVYGRETRQVREQRSASSAYMMELEDVAWVLGMMTGTRTRGPAPVRVPLSNGHDRTASAS
jgi:hypothetical protein